MNSSIWEHFASGSFSPSTSPAFLSGPGAAELARLRQELDEANGTIKQWEESWKQAKQVWGQLLKECRGVAGCLTSTEVFDSLSGPAVHLDGRDFIAMPIFIPLPLWANYMELQPNWRGNQNVRQSTVGFQKLGTGQVDQNTLLGRSAWKWLFLPWILAWRLIKYLNSFFYHVGWNLQACDAWKKEAEEANDRANTANMECELAREQREALELQVKKLQEELERIHTGQDPQFLRSFSDLETLSLSSLYTLQKQLRANLEKVDKVSGRALQGMALLPLLLLIAAPCFSVLLPAISSLSKQFYVNVANVSSRKIATSSLYLRRQNFQSVRTALILMLLQEGIVLRREANGCCGSPARAARAPVVFPIQRLRFALCWSLAGSISDAVSEMP